MKQLCTLIMLALFAGSTVMAQEKGPVASPKQIAKGPHVTVTYGQPSKKGRAIFGGLVPYGQPWRTGANEATEITFDKDVMFAGEKVKAGTYTLVTIPNPDKWTIILNTQLKQWGAFKYDENKSKNIVMTTVPVRPTNDVVEKMTIKVMSDGVSIAWDKTSVMIPVKY